MPRRRRSPPSVRFVYDQAQLPKKPNCPRGGERRQAESGIGALPAAEGSRGLRKPRGAGGFISANNTATSAGLQGEELSWLARRFTASHCLAAPPERGSKAEQADHAHAACCSAQACGAQRASTPASESPAAGRTEVGRDTRLDRAAVSEVGQPEGGGLPIVGP